jgi:superfamily I DNA/RNA helicase
MSYRITNQIADFVNKVMLGEERLLACRNGKYVEFLHRSNRDMITIIASRIRELINQGCKPSDFFILAGSVKSKGDRYNVVREIENILVLKDIPCHIPPFEDEITDERVIEGKVVFSTFHSVKGRQRKYVFVLGFDHNYFTYNARTFNPLECPNTFYVACTRATHGLYICENIENPSFKYLQKTHYEIQNEEYVKFNGLPKGKEIKSKTTKGEFSKITPTDLVKFIPETAFEEIIPILDVLFTDITTEKYGYTQKNIDIHSIIQTKAGFYEDVSDINGIMIPILYFENILNETGGVSFLQRAIETEIFFKTNM